MSYTTIRTAVKDAASTAILAVLPANLQSVQIVQAFDYDKLQSRRIEIMANATPQISGATVTGWDVELIINAVTDAAHYTKAQHETLTSYVESFVMYDDITTRMTNSTVVTQVATPGQSTENILEDHRVTTFNLMLQCYLPAAV